MEIFNFIASIISVISGLMAIIGVRGILEVRRARRKAKTIIPDNSRFEENIPAINDKELFTPSSNLIYSLRNSKLYRLLIPHSISHKPIRVAHSVLLVYFAVTVYNNLMQREPDQAMAKVLPDWFFPISLFIVIPGTIILVWICTIFFSHILNKLYYRIFIKKKEGYLHFIYDKIIPISFSSKFKFSPSLPDPQYFLSYRDDKVGLLDASYNQILPAVFDLIENPYSGNPRFFKVTYNDKVGLYNFDGKIALPIRYDYLRLMGSYVEVEEKNVTKRVSAYGSREMN